MGLAVFTFILLVTNLFRLMDLLINRGVPFFLFLQFLWTLLPPLLIVTAPMAFLVGVLLGVGRLAADNEIMAMRTSGVHLFGVFAPVLLVAALAAAGLWYANSTYVPRLVRTNLYLLDKIKYIVAGNIEAGRVFKPESDMDVALYFRRRNPLTQRMEGVTVKVLVGDAATRQGKAEIVATAREGRIEPNVFAQSMDVVLTSGTLHHFDTSTSISEVRYYTARFGELHYKIALTSRQNLSKDRQARKPREMTTPEIHRTLNNPEIGRETRYALSAEMHQRRSIPLACVAFALLGVPLAIRVRPTGKAVAFSIAFGLIFFYYVMLKWGVSLCQNESAVGVFVIFLPNILVGVTGALLFYRTLRQ